MHAQSGLYLRCHMQSQACGDGWVRQRCRVSCVIGGPTEIGLHWARPPFLATGKDTEGICFLLFLHCHSFSSFSHVPLFHLLYCFFYLSFPFLWETTQSDLQEDVSLNPNTINTVRLVSLMVPCGQV